MARLFNGSNQALAGANIPPIHVADGHALSFSAWMKPASLHNGTLWSLNRGTATDHYIHVGVTSAGAVHVTVKDSTTEAVCTTPGGSYTAGAWMHVAGYVSQTRRTILINGGSKVSETTALTSWVNPFTNWDIGRHRAGVSLRFNGDLAEQAYWHGVELSDAQIGTLYTGVSPHTVEHLNLVTYMRIKGDDSPEKCSVSRRYATLTGTPTQSVHPPTVAALPDPQFEAVQTLFSDEMRIAVGTNDRIHAIGKAAGVFAVEYRYSDDQGANWSTAETLITTATSPRIPLYWPMAADGDLLALVTREGSSLYARVSTDGGANWGGRVQLTGYTADVSDRVHCAVQGTDIHVFAGRAGTVPISGDNFSIYYWVSHNSGATFSAATVLEDETFGGTSPGNLSAAGDTVHVGYARFDTTDTGILPHRGRYMRSSDAGATWDASVDVSGGIDHPQIRPRAHALAERVYVGWEELLDHDESVMEANATVSDIVMNRSTDNGATWLGPTAITEWRYDYVSHPEFHVGPGPHVHVLFRMSQDQPSDTLDTEGNDTLAYRRSDDYGVTWGRHRLAIHDPSATDHPYQINVTAGYVHVVSEDGRYTRVAFTPLTEPEENPEEEETEPTFSLYAIMALWNASATDWTRPAQGAFTITAGAGALSHPIRGIYVGVSGNVTVTTVNGESVQFVGLAAGVIHPIAATHVTAATATSIVGVY